MHILLKNIYNQDFVVPYESMSLREGANLDYDEEVSEFMGYAGFAELRMSDRHFNFLSANPQICSIKDTSSHIIDMPLRAVFEMVAKASDEGKSSLDLSAYSGKAAYNKWTYPAAGQEKTEAEVEQITQKWLDGRGWYRKFMDLRPTHKMI